MHTNQTNTSPEHHAALPRTHMKEWFHLSYALPFLVLVSALVVTYQLWQDERRDVVRALQAEFDSRVHEAGTLVEQRMKTYEQVMRGVDGLFAHAGNVTREEFRDYIARLRLKESYPGIQGIRFSPLVPLAQKDRHIAAVRKEGFPEYTIRPEGERGYYAPVLYAEPFDERNQAIFGYDTYSDLEHPRPGDSGAGLRRAAMERARDTGQAAVSGKIRLLFEADRDAQAGFLMFLPVYKHDAPHDSVTERRASIIGWISSVFRVDDLMAGIFGEHAAGLDTDLYDGGDISDKTLMYDSDRSGGVNELNARFHKTTRLEIAGRTWMVETRSLPGFEAQMDKGKPQIIAIGGSGVGLLLALLTWLLVHGRVRALHAAREIGESEAKLQAILDNVPTGIWLVGMDERYRFVNKTFCDAVGVPESRFLATNHLTDLLGEEVAAACLESDRACIGLEAPYLSQETITFVDGKPHLLEITKVKLHDNAGEVIGIVGISTDITERKRAEEALSASENQLRLLLDTAAEAICGIDKNGIATFCNPACLRLLGYQHADDLIGKNLHQLIHYKHADGKPFPEEACRIYQAFLASTDVHAEDEVFWRADGTSFNVEYWSHPQLRDGVVTGAVVTFLDISERAKANEKLLKLSRAVENSPASVVITDMNGTIEYVNARFTRVTGYTLDEAIGQNPRLLKSGIQPPEFYKELWETILAGMDWQGEICNRKKNGELFVEHASISPVRDENGAITHFVAVKEDITRRKQADRALIENREKLYAIVDTALDAVVQMDTEGIITGWNHQAEKTFGWTSEEAVGRLLSETIIPPLHREAHTQGLKRFMASGEGYFMNSRVETTGLHRDGHEFPVELSLTSIRTVGEIEFSAFIRDITHKKESDELIWKQANFDSLTQLPNRSMFYDRLVQEIKKAHRAGLTMALMFIDLDRFKEINDTLGHNMGDILLVEAARRIVECVRETDTVARLGGDEFTVTLAEIEDAGSIDRVAQEILRKLAEPFRLGGEMIYISASIGITLYPEDADNIDELLKNADQAMYISKEKGRGRFAYFTPLMQETAQNRLRLINDLRGALLASQFMVYYQPIVDLATGRINKAEALIRWKHPERGMVSPALFIPLAEETGLIIEIGEWVLMEAMCQANRWRKSYNTGFQISVNMSPVQFRNSSSQDDGIWSTCLREMGMPGQNLVIEITEGLLLDAESGVTARLGEFRDAGIQLSLDDFGTGYSSLSYLKKFDIDYLKIDQSFTRNLAPESSDMALSEAIIVMAHKLGMKVIAEGVETEAQRKLLADAGCDYGQGYLFSRPIPAVEFEVLLNNQYQYR